jgi:predicted dehydrogenase
MNNFSVAVVGLGSIGSLKPDNTDMPNDNDNFLTHVHALIYLQNTENMFTITAAVDPDTKKQIGTAQKWGITNFYNSIDELIHHDKSPRIIVIATPTEFHLDNVIKSVQDPLSLPSLIVLEKPAGVDFFESKKILALSILHRVPIVVNYSRLFCEKITSYKKKIIDREYGKLHNVVVRYTRGLKRDGCHAINLLNFLLGRLLDFCTFNDSAIIDLDELDPTCMIYLKYEECANVVMVPCDGRASAVFTLDFWFDNKRVVFEEYGQKIFEYSTHKDGVYGNYKTMASSPDDIILTNLNKNLVSMYKNVYNYLTNGEKLKCTIEDAHLTQEVIYKLRSSES